MTFVPQSPTASAFDDLADQYDADGSHAALADRLVALAADTAGGYEIKDEIKVVLDAGTGTGAAARAALTAFPDAEVVAVDISPKMIRRARQLTGAAAADARIRWECAPAVPFPAADGSADLVLCASTLHFLGLAAFEDWRRLLRPGGFAAFTLPWRDRFRPGPRFSASLPPAAQQLPLPGSVEDAQTLQAEGFATVAVAAAERAALFVLRRLPGD